MKRSISLLLLLLCFILPLVTSQKTVYGPHPHQDAIDKLKICQKMNTTQLNYRGKSPISNSDDSADQVLCVGDAFGDLNETYVIIKDCYLAMYHRERLLWSSKINAYYRAFQEGKFNDIFESACAISLERDGNLVLYKSKLARMVRVGLYQDPQFLWDSQTNFHPVKTELRIQNLQIQIVQTFSDGTQRLFYADEKHQEFIEDLGTPRKVADKFIIKRHSDEDRISLRRNEYIGDINQTHLILQTNCDLQLLNKTKVLWSFIPPFRHEMNCTLSVARDNHTIEIFARPSKHKAADYVCQNRMGRSADYNRERLMKHQESFKVVETRISFEGDQPVITQTLKNGDELIFCGMPGQNSGLTLRRSLRQIAQRTFPFVSEESDDLDDSDIIKRMDYIGNLTGLHLILEQNCSLIFANGNKKLWEFQSEPPPQDTPLMECSVVFSQDEPPKLIKEFANPWLDPWRQPLLEDGVFSWRSQAGTIGFQLTLENDQIIIERECSDKEKDVFYAGPKTNGSFFQFMAPSSRVVNLDHDFVEILPKMGYIGDLDGVYTILDKRCNWILYNKTQVLWESGSSSNDDWHQCGLFIEDSGQIDIYPGLSYGHGVFSVLWSELNFPETLCSSKKVLKTELLVNNDGLWLIHTLRNGTAEKYKAMKETNSFAFVSKNDYAVFGLEFQ